MYGWLTANSPSAMHAEVTYRRERLARDWGHGPSRFRGRRLARHQRAAARAIPAPRSATRAADHVRADR